MCVLFQESTDFKIVTVDLTEEEQSTWHSPQITPERSVILEGHRDLWGEYIAGSKKVCLLMLSFPIKKVRGSAARLLVFHLFLW